MRSFRRFTGIIALLVTLALSLTGCMHADRSVTLNSDGSGTYTMTIGFSEQLVSLASDQISSSMDSFGAKVKSEGGTYRHYDDTGYSYWSYTRPFKTVAELNSLVQQAPQAGNSAGATGSPSLPSTSQDTLSFTQQSGFLSNTFHVTGHMSLNFPQSTTDAGGIDLSPYLKDMRESFAVTMPGSVTSHKGGVVNGNTVTYTIHYGEETDIDVVGGGLNTALLLPIGAGAGVALLLIIVGIVIWRLRRRKPAPQQVAPEAAPAFVAAAPDAPTTPGFAAQPDGADNGDATQG